MTDGRSPRRRVAKWRGRITRGLAGLGGALLASFSLNFCSPRSPLCLGLPGPSDPNAHLARADDIRALRSSLEAITTEESGSMHRLLWRATWLLRDCTLDRPWDEVGAALDEMALEYVSIGACDLSIELGMTIWNDREFAVPGLGFRSVGGLWHQLTIAFTVYEGDDGVERVGDAAAGLRCRIDRPYREVLDQDLYRPDSIAHAALTSADVVDEARLFRDLANVSFRFVHTVFGFQSRWVATIDSGIEASMSFRTQERPDDQGDHWEESWLELQARSAIEPTRTWGGNYVGWRSSPDERVGEFRMSGGGRWGSTQRGR